MAPRDESPTRVNINFFFVTVDPDKLERLVPVNLFAVGINIAGKVRNLTKEP